MKKAILIQWTLKSDTVSQNTLFLRFPCLEGHTVSAWSYHTGNNMERMVFVSSFTLETFHCIFKWCIPICYDIQKQVLAMYAFPFLPYSHTAGLHMSGHVWDYTCQIAILILRLFSKISAGCPLTYNKFFKLFIYLFIVLECSILN